VAETPIVFPLTLNSELEEFNIASVAVRRMEDADRLRLFGFRSAEINEDGLLRSISGVDSGGGRDMFSAALALGVTGIDKLYASNYVAALSSHEEAINLNFVLKLLGGSFTSLFIGFQEQKRFFLSPPCYYGSNALAIGSSDLDLASQLMELTCRSRDRKLKIMSEKLLYALSSAPKRESRFLELSIILEMLLLPSSSSELSYRFALRMAKFLAKHEAADAAKVFEAGKQIYNVRSSLVHNGYAKKLLDVESQAEDYVRRFLRNYLINPDRFNEASLDELCVSG